MAERSKTAAVLSLLAVVGLALALAGYLQGSNDLPWHLKAGEWIVKNRAVPRVDFFSFSRQGLPWLDVQWLFQVVIYTVYARLGPAGLTALNMALATTVFALMLFAVPSRLPLGLRTFFGFFFLLSINPRLMLRPELLSCLFMATMFFLLERAQAGRERLLWCLPLLQILWVNSEGVWPVGIGIVLAYLGDEVWRKWKRGNSFRPPAGRQWWIAAALVTAAGFLQPYGLSGFLFPLTLFREITLSSTFHKQVIVEVQPLFSPPWYPGAVIPFLLLSGLTLVFTGGAGGRLRPCLSLLGLYFLFTALHARRNVSLSSVMLFQLLLVHAAEVTENRRFLLQPRLEAGAASAALIGSAFFIILSLLQPLRTWDGSGRESGFGLSRQSNPVAAAEFLKAIGYRGNIINDEGVGGELIFAGWPEWKVFADSRMEVGGEEALRFYYTVFGDRSAFQRVVYQYQVEAVVVYHVLPHLRKFSLGMIQEREWALVYLDWSTAVFLRRTEQWSAVIADREIPAAEVYRKLQRQKERAGRR